VTAASASTADATKEKLMPLRMDRRQFALTSSAWGLSLFMPQARACEFMTNNFKVVHPWSAPTAQGDTIARVGMTITDITANDRLIGAESSASESVEMVADGKGRSSGLALRPGEELFFTPSGTHLRLIALKAPLVPGGYYTLMLKFETTGLVPTQLTVERPRFL
jgi:copper(I)-binding protein